MQTDPYTSAPQSSCEAVSPWLPLLRTGALTSDTETTIEEHLRTCASCLSQRAEFERVEAALRSVYGVGASAFQPITVEEIGNRVEQRTIPDIAQLTYESAELVASEQELQATISTPQYSLQYSPQYRRSRGWRPPAWAPRLATVAAVITLVALFALVFQTLTPKGSGTATPQPPATVPAATATPIRYLGAHARWEQSAQVQGDPRTPYMIYSVSQADPRVMYRYQLVVKQVERSDNSGASWQTLPIPTQDLAPNDSPSVIVSPSPLDARVVVLTYQLLRGNATCPSGDFCQIQYISMDGGQHWQRLRLAAFTSLSVVGFAHPYESLFMAQGTHLFAALRSDNGAFSGYHIVMSADGGASWATVDDAIVGSKQSVVEGVATPTGSTLFALTVAAGTPVVSATEGTRLLWRSDDQGKHWARVGAFPDVSGSRSRWGTASTHLAAATIGLDNRPLLYYVDESETPEQQAQPMTAPAIAPEHIFVSRDGGNTWLPAPRSGIPGNDQVALASVGQLADGSIVMEFSRLTTTQLDPNTTFVQSDTAYYAWKPGDTSWRQLTSTAPGKIFLQQWLTPARSDIPETIWALTRQGATLTLQRCALS